MEPIPETRAALSDLDRAGSEGLLADLRATAGLVRRIAPHCVGLSLSYLRHGLTFTLVATGEEIAALDGVQYVADGPCLRAIEEDGVVATDGSTLMNEESWRLFALASAAAGVASTLSMPLRSQGAVTGGVNLYGASDDAFAGRTEALADVLGAWAPGAVTNADLAFDTRLEAVRAPGHLRDQGLVDRATGIISAAQGVDLETARDRLLRAAALAGISEARLARTMIESHRP